MKQLLRTIFYPSALVPLCDLIYCGCEPVFLTNDSITLRRHMRDCTLAVEADASRDGLTWTWSALLSTSIWLLHYRGVGKYSRLS